MIPQGMWTYRKVNRERADALAEALQVSPITAGLLTLRGIESPREAQRFLSPSLEDLVDPFCLTGMKKAVDRILLALKEGEKILVYGDYDADGITAVALLYSCLQELEGQVSFYIPSRFDEGYGLHAGALQKAADEGTSLIITVDCGESGGKEIQAAAARGMDVIVTDHHQPQGEVEAFAHINPLREGPEFPVKNLAGVGVAFKLAQALFKTCRRDGDWVKYLDLAALGTVADIVPLLGENRILVKYGLNVINERERPGLKALIEAAALGEKTVEAGHIAFILAPRLNAAGRMGEAWPGVELLTTRDRDRAERIAGDLNDLNKKRQQVEQEIYDEACRRLEQEAGAREAGALVLGEAGWHPGVLGIVASRLSELYWKPVILLSLDGQGLATGSGRSIPGFNLVKALKEASPLLERFGGHELAAGLTLKEERIPELRETMEALAERNLTAGDREKKILLDSKVEGKDLSLSLAEELALLAPFGYGNPQPLLGGSFRVVEKRRVGKNGSHLKLQVEDDRRARYSALYFRNGSQGEAPLRSRQVELAFFPEASLWRGSKELSLMVKQWSFSDAHSKGRVALVDHRGRRKKPYLEELLNYSPGNIMVYVNTRQEERMLAPLAREGKVFLLHQGRGAEGLKQEVEAGGEAGSKAGSKAGGETEAHLVFWSLPLREEAFSPLLQDLGTWGRLHLHLLYGEEDYRQNRRLLKASLPGKEILTELWAALDQSRAELPQAGRLKRELERKLDFPLTHFSVERALAILEEARQAFPDGEGLAPGQPGFWEEFREKSSLYREDSATLEKAETFQEFFLTAAKEDLAAYINRMWGRA